MTSSLPQRQTLVDQTVKYLKSAISDGAWSDCLPGERTLCAAVQVSRNTLRAAIDVLVTEGWIQRVHGVGNQVRRPRRQRRANLQSHDVGLLTADALERLRPMQTLWIDELRGMLGERNCRLRVFHGPQYFRKNPAAMLSRLVARNPHGCWILHLSNETMQRWFAQKRVPCVVAGSVHHGIDLPGCDVDNRAACHHAAGTMLAAGHRKVAVVIRESQQAGDLESQDGFLGGVSNSPHPNAKAIVASHDGTLEGLINLVRRLTEQAQPPTALLVTNPLHCLTVMTRLMQKGMRIPQDVSVMCRDDDPFLTAVVPEIARYVIDPHAMARALFRSVLGLLEGNQVSHAMNLIMPTFVPGGSVGRLPEI